LPVASPNNEEIEALACYYGRVYVSTSRIEPGLRPQVLVSGVAPWGRLESRVHDFGVPVGAAVLSWDGFAPVAGSRVVLQTRYGATLEQLESRPFVGPGGDPAGRFDVSGTPLDPEHEGSRYFQYAVELECPDEVSMPLLRSVTLAAESLAASAGPAGTTAGGAGPPHAVRPMRPKTAQRRAGIAVRLIAPATAAESAPQAVRIRLFDPAGRLVRRAGRELRPGGEAIWTWDLRDTAGYPVLSGVYQVAVDAPGSALAPARRALVVLR
jgi:hypothetical protein